MKGRLLAMKKSFVLTALLMAALIVLVGCASTPKIGDLINDALQGKGDQLSDIFDGLGDGVGDSIGGIIKGDTDPGRDNSFEGIFDEYREAKGNLISTITRGVNADPGMGITTGLSLVNIYEVDAAMWPAFVLWDTDQAVKATGAFVGMTDIEIVKTRNNAVVNYLDENGNQVTFTANYDEDNVHYKFTSDSENGNRPVMEIVKTPFGLVGQSYTGGIGMLENLYLISIEGDRGMVGVIHDTSAPSLLTGSETFDFPKLAAAEWYHYEDGRLTGVDQSGNSFEIENP